jgi:hypothetical protein
MYKNLQNIVGRYIIEMLRNSVLFSYPAGNRSKYIMRYIIYSFIGKLQIGISNAIGFTNMVKI